MSEKAARETVQLASNKYRIPVPEILFASKNSRRGRQLPSQYDPTLHRITLRPRHLNGAIVLHETAHAITDWILGTGLEPHGREWLGVYMVLLEDYQISPRVALHASADAAGLAYHPRALVGPATIRKRNRKRVREARAERMKT